MSKKILIDGEEAPIITTGDAKDALKSRGYDPDTTDYSVIFDGKAEIENLKNKLEEIENSLE